MFSSLFSGVASVIQQAMGNHYSVFVRALKRGDAAAAVDMYNRKKSVRESIKPNELSGDTQANTILHHLAKLNMISVYNELLLTGNAIPDMKNNQRENCLHLICQGPGKQAVKANMLGATIDVFGLHGMDLHHVLSEKDQDGNAVLHLAAQAGLDDCVELLIIRGADLSATNEAKETPADLATKAGHTQLATTMETKMVFEGDDLTVPEPELPSELSANTKGLKDNELRSMKDALLIETANMLGVSLLTAQVLLRDHDWSKEGLLEAWFADAAGVCERSGVDLPQVLGAHQLDVECVGGASSEGVLECEVCCLATPPDVTTPCQHHFCKDCWKQYLEDKIASGESHSISCPQYACYQPVPLGVIELVVSPEMARKFLSFDIKAFVDSNPNIHWCPRAGCGQAVSLTTDPTIPSSPDTEVTVQCGNNHYFCWACMRDPHAPVSCDIWSQWLRHVEDMRPRVGDTTAAEADEAASSRWLADRSKPCPKCRSPIEKTEGCNHMCCKNCKHDFCWVCLDNWKCHNSSTGGYFECNRYDAQKKASSLLGQRRDSYYGDAKELEAVSRFLHYYERYKEHLNSLALEEPFLDKARDKMELLAASVRGLEVSDDMTFIEEAVRELLHCRRVLQASYPYSYYLKTPYQRRSFEGLQGSLEAVTEMLAEVVARPHLRKPRSEIIRLTHEARTKRGFILDHKPHKPARVRPLVTMDTSDSDDAAEDTDITTFLRMLERQPNTTINSNKGRDRSHDTSHAGQKEENELLQALELSRQEFEADKQLQEDIEKAKAESVVVEPLTPAPLTLEPCTTDWPITLEPYTPPTTDWLRLDNDDYETLSWPVLRLHTPPHSPPHTSHTAHAEWGPVVSEEGDLDIAMAMSLQQQEEGGDGMMDISGPQLVDSNKLSDGEWYGGLPSELQHLMDTHRPGEHV